MVTSNEIIGNKTCIIHTLMSFIFSNFVTFTQEQDKTPLRTKSPSNQNPPPAKTPLRPKPPSAKTSLRPNPPPPKKFLKNPPTKIALWPKPPSGKKPPPAKKKKNILSTPLLSLINKYHPKLRLFYIKFRLGYARRTITFCF